jgi:hypothetical protein
MFASIEILDRPTLDGVADGYVLDEVGSGRTRLVALRAEAGGAGDLYEVEEDVAGPDASATPGAAALLTFDGPQSPARIEAARRAFRDRIAPLMRATPGCVRALVLWQPDTCAYAVLNVAVSLDALAAIGEAVTNSPLLPGEDVALLPGPDRVAVNRVTAHIQGALA